MKIRRLKTYYVFLLCSSDRTAFYYTKYRAFSKKELFQSLKNSDIGFIFTHKKFEKFKKNIDNINYIEVNDNVLRSPYLEN